MRITLSALAIAAAALTAIPASAQQLTNEKSVVEGLSVTNVGDLLRELNAREVTPATDGKSLTFMDGTIPYNVALVGCDKGPGCIATIIFVIVDLPLFRCGGKMSIIQHRKFLKLCLRGHVKTGCRAG